MEHVPWARDLARRLLAEPLPTRWAHTQGVGRAAGSIAHVVGPDADVLACAAWLHDIGYSPAIAHTGFHPLDGARHLRDVEQAGDRLCRLVANHTGAVVEARNRGLSKELADEFPPVGGLLADALTYADMSTGPTGDPTDAEARLAEILSRYEPGSVVARSITESRPVLLHQVAAVSAALQARR